MTHPTDAMVEQVARALAPLAWAALGLADTLVHQNRRKASLNHARAAIAAYEAALKEAGLVVVPREPTPAMLCAEHPSRIDGAISLEEYTARAVWESMIAAGQPAPIGGEYRRPNADLKHGMRGMLAAASPAPKDTKEGE